MRLSRMLIHRFCRLRAPVAIRGVIIQRAHAVLAGNALERDAAIHRFGCVMSHKLSVVPNSSDASGHWVCDFRVKNGTLMLKVIAGNQP